MLTVLIVIVASLALGLPLARWMHIVATGAPSPLDRLFDPVDAVIHRLIGWDSAAPMGWRLWARWILATNAVLGAAIYLLLLAQGALPLNPDGVKGMDWELALHTAASFITNTNQQHYSGQAQLSYLGQLAAVVTAQVVTPAVGLAAMFAALRGLVGGAEGRRTDAVGDIDLGNYPKDLVRSVTRVLLPLATIWALALTSQGVPSTLHGAVVATPIDAAAGLTEQVIPLGPVAAMVAIKQLGTNGGGWYGPNSAVPLENPTPVSNVLELLAIVLLPLACAFLIGRMTDRGLGRVAVASMLILAVALCAPVIWLELGTNTALTGIGAPGPNWEGKELRLGVESTGMWATLTTMTSNGSVNGMHDSLLPLSGLFPLIGMFINSAFGGVGVGVINLIVYLILAVFVAGLLIGRTPELLGRKVEVKEVRVAALASLLIPLCVLLPTALSFELGLANTSNPGPHGLSQVLYEYASAAANNGSGFEGLGDGTPWWNLTCAAVLVLARFIPIIAPLAIVGRLATKSAAPRTAGTLSVGSGAFLATLLGVIVTLQLLTYVPALALGPVAEQLAAEPGVTAVEAK